MGSIAKLAGAFSTVFLLYFIFGCQDKKADIERFMEDGVEVVVNHIEPYKIKGEPNSLLLEEEFTIDAERNEIAEIGVSDIEDFDIDSKGNIYFFQMLESDKNLVYKFDENANFVSTFGKKGQGPGEIEFPRYQYITPKGEIPIQDENRPILFIFDGNGSLIKETKFDSESSGYFTFFPLQNGNYLGHGLYFDRSTKHRGDLLTLFNSKFEKLKELDRCDYGKAITFTQQKKKFTPRVFIYQVSGKKIYVGHENRGYEILVYDLNANLVKKIRKKYNPVSVPDDFKEYLRANIGRRVEDRLDFPENMPPFHYFFLDDEGRLYFKTYEKGDKPGDYIHDIFNSDGVFITRESIPGYGRRIYPWTALNRAKAKNHRLYCIREKTSGFKELVVYKMIWE